MQVTCYTIFAKRVLGEMGHGVELLAVVLFKTGKTLDFSDECTPINQPLMQLAPEHYRCVDQGSAEPQLQQVASD